MFSGQQDACPQLKENEPQAKPRTVSSKGPNGDSRPATSPCRALDSGGGVSSQTLAVSVSQEALADMVDFRAQDHSFLLHVKRLRLLGGVGGLSTLRVTSKPAHTTAQCHWVTRSL